MRARWIFIGLLGLLLVTAVLVRLYMPATVETARVTTGPAVEVVYATGFVEVEEPVEIAARVTAPIVEIMVEEGERVAKGAVLARLDPASEAGELERLAALTRLAEIEAGRTGTLARKGFASAAARDRANADLEAARAAEKAARDRLGNFLLRASINGVVLRRDAEPGDLATPTKTLLVLGDTTRTKVTATIDERDIPRIRVGQQAVMSSEAYPGRVFNARVREITLGGDPEQRAFRARLEPLSREPLPIGLTLEVNIVTRTKENALLVPESALAEDAVWRLEGGTAQKVQVRTGIAGSETVEIMSGLAAGDTVILNPSEGLAEGARVRTAEAK